MSRDGESAFIERLRSQWPVEGEASNELIALADEAVRLQPDSPRLWCMRGNLIQLGTEECPHSLEDALNCYLRAVEIDPDFVEGYEDAGYFYFNIMDDPKAARPFFAKARALKKR